MATGVNWYIGDLFNSKHSLLEVRAWCTAQFGLCVNLSEPAARPAPEWSNYSNSLFRFRNEKDYMLFLLKWT